MQFHATLKVNKIVKNLLTLLTETKWRTSL